MYRFENILRIIKTYLLTIGIFFIFRFILFITNIARVNISEDGVLIILQSFLLGIRFDIVISGYILLIPTIVLSIMDVIGKKSIALNKIIFYWIFILFTLAFIISAADIPYFNQFFSRFSIGAFAWIDSIGIVLKMIIQEPSYYLILIPLLIISIIFYKLLKKIFIVEHNKYEMNIYLKIFLSLSLVFLIIIGIRGRIGKSPIRVGTAYYCNNAFLNKLGLNPVFTLLNSYIDSKNEDNENIKLIDEKNAINNVKKELNIKEQIFASPIARSIVFDNTNKTKANVVLIIMESMGSVRMKGYGGGPSDLTVFLDSLKHESLFFSNIYTAGIHTHVGIFSTLCSFPSLFRQNQLKLMKKFNSLSYTLKQNGYSTTFFVNHDSQFDNMEGFMRTNYFDNIISQKNYPSKEIKTSFGVPDDYMFEYSIPIINKLYSNGNPFLATYMTTSNHGPFYIPDYYQPRHTDKFFKSVEYADWSLRKFIKMASKQEWFDNTFFVFIADHGALMSTPYDISLEYHLTPLIIYAPKLLNKSETFDYIGGQIDVYPTIMGLLELPYLNNTLGIDLLNEHRKYTIINNDEKIGVLGDKFFLVINDDRENKLYNYKENDKHDYLKEYFNKANEMEIYAKSNMQVFQYMLNNNLQFIEPKNK